MQLVIIGRSCLSKASREMVADVKRHFKLFLTAYFFADTETVWSLLIICYNQLPKRFYCPISFHSHITGTRRDFIWFSSARAYFIVNIPRYKRFIAMAPKRRQISNYLQAACDKESQNCHRIYFAFPKNFDKSLHNNFLAIR